MQFVDNWKRWSIAKTRAYIVQILQDQNTFRLSRITLLRGPPAKLIRMKVLVFSDSTLVVAVSHPDPSINCATKFEDVWNEHGFGEVRFIWHVPHGASTNQIKKHFQEYLNGQKARILRWDDHLSMFNARIFWRLDHIHVNVQRHWRQRKACRNLFAQCQTIGSICDQIQARTLVFLGARVRTYVVELKFKRIFRKMKNVVLRMVDILKYHTSHPIFPSTEPSSLGQLRKGGTKYHFPRYIRQQEDSHECHIGKQFVAYCQSKLPVVWDWTSGTYTKNSGSRRANRSPPQSSWFWLRKKQWKMTQQASFARSVMDGDWSRSTVTITTK